LIGVMGMASVMPGRARQADAVVPGAARQMEGGSNAGPGPAGNITRAAVGPVLAGVAERLHAGAAPAGARPLLSPPGWLACRVGRHRSGRLASHHAQARPRLRPPWRSARPVGFPAGPAFRRPAPSGLLPAQARPVLRAGRTIPAAGPTGLPRVSATLAGRSD